MASTNHQSPGLLPIDWPVWLTILIVFIALTSSIITTHLTTPAALTIHTISLLLALIALHEIYAKYQRLTQ